MDVQEINEQSLHFGDKDEVGILINATGYFPAEMYLWVTYYSIQINNINFSC